MRCAYVLNLKQHKAAFIWVGVQQINARETRLVTTMDLRSAGQHAQCIDFILLLRIDFESDDL
jgi:hypothetical protein